MSFLECIILNSTDKCSFQLIMFKIKYVSNLSTQWTLHGISNVAMYFTHTQLNHVAKCPQNRVRRKVIYSTYTSNKFGMKCNNVHE